MIVSSALMIWKGLIVITGSESPIVVVLSGSMEPAFHRGDLLFLTNFHDDPIRAGEIVVFKVEGRDIPIVHRVIKIHEKENGDIKFLTKGDNNEVDDRGLYKEGQNWLEKKDVVGRARGFLPYVGMVTIIMNDYPKFKVALCKWKALTPCAEVTCNTAGRVEDKALGLQFVCLISSSAATEPACSLLSVGLFRLIIFNLCELPGLFTTPRTHHTGWNR
ncbi:signal peptidase complex catalytic subunit SEC11C isoform X1 [Apteryx rowi]|uniref:signal peptidase complex catalytic subunit SEC11C isoform X1 n=1 Tax=Apteryx rowi TaxID=308060 RepID=UPI000E1C4A47|nr:signal peptidase complex catalytic subunit SEC11C isoform X1 [Apteryx rowi]